jgi:dCMP deaminase
MRSRAPVLQRRGCAGSRIRNQAMAAYPSCGVVSEPKRSTGRLEQNLMNQNKWDIRYLEMAALVASWSKDPRAKVGAVVVRNNRVVATGFNGLPSEVLDNEERLTDKKMKLEMTVHAEENALIVAGRNAEGATIYVHGKPVCARCAGSIIQARIQRVVAMHPEMDDNKKSFWRKVGLIALRMLGESGIQFHAKVLGPRESIKDSATNGSRETQTVPGIVTELPTNHLDGGRSRTNTNGHKGENAVGSRGAVRRDTGVVDG